MCIRSLEPIDASEKSDATDENFGNATPRRRLRALLVARE